MTPAVYVKTARVRAARIALETGEKAIDSVAQETGLQSSMRMRCTFHCYLGVTAGEYCDRFRQATKGEGSFKSAKSPPYWEPIPGRFFASSSAAGAQPASQSLAAQP